MDYSFLAYAVGITSAIPIPSLEPAPVDSARFTVRFEVGPEPEWVKVATRLPARVLLRLPADQATLDPTFTLTEHGSGKGYALLYSQGARFVFNEGLDRLWGTFWSPLTLDDLYILLVGPVMGFLLRQRHITCLHASAVELYGRAILFSGEPGYGKSTTAAALALRGASVLAEDIVPLELRKGSYFAVPGYPRVCLWPDSVAKLLGKEDSLPLLSSTWGKRYLQLNGPQAKFAGEKKPLGIIYLLGERSEDSCAPFVQEIPSSQAVLGLVQNTYMNYLIDRQRRAEEFDDLCKIVEQVPVRRIVAHTDAAKLGALCECVFEDARATLETVPVT